MLTEEQIQKNKRRFKILLLKTKRKGMQKLIDLLETKEFFTLPASSKYHCNYEGGLCEHSLSVYDTFLKIKRNFLNDDIYLTNTNIRIVCLLHDICKIIKHPETHGQKSIDIAKRFVQLHAIEENMILVHMDYFAIKMGDILTTDDLMKIHNRNNEIRLLHIADYISSQYLEKVMENDTT